VYLLSTFSWAAYGNMRCRQLYGKLFFSAFLNEKPIVTETFEIEHKYVLESVRKITEPKNGLSEK
jgi:hypothetical protein